MSFAIYFVPPPDFIIGHASKPKSFHEVMGDLKRAQSRRRFRSVITANYGFVRVKQFALMNGKICYSVKILRQCQ